MATKPSQSEQSMTKARETDTLDPGELLRALTSFKKGDFSVRPPVEYTGVAGKIADTFNDAVELTENMTKEFERISNVVGIQGKVTERASLQGAGGSWADSVDAVNGLPLRGHRRPEPSAQSLGLHRQARGHRPSEGARQNLFGRHAAVLKLNVHEGRWV